ncbi:MAG: flavin reductase [Thaumarchaeota archaeon]|nr:flavin reductase [Nitrososphaerota archaeon]
MGREAAEGSINSSEPTSPQSPARKVKPPIINECMTHLECRLHDKIEVGECAIFIGEGLEVYYSKEVFEKGMWRR